MSEQGEALDAEIDRCVQAACNHEPGVDCRECYIRGLVRRLGARVGRLSRQVEELEAALLASTVRSRREAMRAFEISQELRDLALEVTVKGD